MDMENCVVVGDEVPHNPADLHKYWKILVEKPAEESALLVIELTTNYFGELLIAAYGDEVDGYAATGLALSEAGLEEAMDILRRKLREINYHTTGGLYRFLFDGKKSPQGALTVEDAKEGWKFRYSLMERGIFFGP